MDCLGFSGMFSGATALAERLGATRNDSDSPHTDGKPARTRMSRYGEMLVAAVPPYSAMHRPRTATSSGMLRRSQPRCLEPPCRRWKRL